MTAPTETPPEALERLRKLLRLSKSDNPNEAAVAAAAALASEHEHGKQTAPC